MFRGPSISRYILYRYIYHGWGDLRVIHHRFLAASASSDSSRGGLERAIARNNTQVISARDCRSRARRKTPVVVVARTYNTRACAQRCRDVRPDTSKKRTHSILFTRRSFYFFLFFYIFFLFILVDRAGFTPRKLHFAFVTSHSGHVTQTELTSAPSHCTTLLGVTSPWRERSEARRLASPSRRLVGKRR